MTEAGSRTEGAAPGRRPSTLGLSLHRRVGRFALLIVVLAVLVTSLGAYLGTRVAAIKALDVVLASSMTSASESLGPDPDQAAIDRFLSNDRELGLVVTAVVRSDGQVFRVPGAVAFTVQARDVGVAAGRTGAISHTTSTDDGVPYRVLVVPISTQAGLALLVGRPLTGVDSILTALALGLAISGVVAIGVAALAGRRVARAGLAPVLDLTTEVEQRARADDLKPVRVSEIDEIGRLAVAFNVVLDAVRVSRTRQSRFVADAGHELRTPLTSMRTNIDLLTADSDRAMLPTAERSVILREVRTQLMEFSALVSDLIGLTREDRTVADFDELDLAAVLETAIDRVSSGTNGLHWVVDLDPVVVHGDPDLLIRAFTNVLDNAVKYSPTGGTISVTLGGAEVHISDEGVGVSPEDRLLVFDRFFRSESSRGSPGSGLGLSITESVVLQHGGTVAVVDAPGGGAMFVLTFPGVSESDHGVAVARISAPLPAEVAGGGTASRAPGVA